VFTESSTVNGLLNLEIKLSKTLITTDYTKKHVVPAEAHYCPEYFVMPAEAGIQRLRSLDSSQKHAGMTVSERLFEFKSICSLTMSKAAWYARMRHVRDYYSGQQCVEAGIQRLTSLGSG
jgi:hypothetical protein